MNSQRLLIIGHGFVGSAVDYGFTHPKIEKTIIDPKYGTSLNDVDPSNFDFIFVCVPTPMGDGGTIDTSIIDNVISHIRSAPGVIVVKSTVPPPVIARWETLNIPNLVYNPEFLTEKSAAEQFVSPHFQIIGGSKGYAQRVEQLYTEYSLCSPCPFIYMTAKEASFVKYTINSFLALKVTFFNQLYDAVAETDANFATIIKAVGADPRIGPSHTKVPGFDGKRGFGGACLPKDTLAFTECYNQLTLLDRAITINNQYRVDYQLDGREFQQNISYNLKKDHP